MGGGNNKNRNILGEGGGFCFYKTLFIIWAKPFFLGGGAFFSVTFFLYIFHSVLSRRDVPLVNK